MGNSASSGTEYDNAYTAPVSYPVVEESHPVVKQLKLPPRTTPKGIDIKNNNKANEHHNNTLFSLHNNTFNGEVAHHHLVGSQPLKIIILGKESVGKASFVNRTTKGSPDKSYCPTETVFKTMLLKKTNVTFQIVMVNDDMYLDADLFYDAVAVFCMYDMTTRESFHAIESVYLPFIRRCCPYSVVKVLIASKVDGWPEVTADEGKLMGLMNHMHYCEVSTKDNINMQKPFLHVSEAVAQTHAAYSV